MRFRIVLHITIFSKIVSFSEKITEKNFFGWEGGIDISIFYVKTIDNTIETIDGFAKTIDSFRLSTNTKEFVDRKVCALGPVITSSRCRSILQPFGQVYP